MLTKFGSQVNTIEDAAALLELSVVETSEFMRAWAPDIHTASRKAELTGEHQHVLARALMAKALAKIGLQLDTADGFEAVELSKPILRLLENHERVQLAKREAENLPLVHISFINRTMQVQVLDKGGPRPTGEVIDVIGHAPGDGADHVSQ